ncbi:hypothetical protein [Nocardia higoensis]|uniref:hypothetical protein n=1 Tax=Nocardia higoensis TaxID=228599 RepID=UPI0002D2BF43|nr:hypothetical protein [Nocardia higoensis]
MKRTITGLALAGALLFPGQLAAAGSVSAGAPAAVPAEASEVADGGSSAYGCTLECGPLMQLWIALYESLAVGSSGGGGAPAAS